MAPHRTIIQRLKSILGAVLVGLGMFILYANTAGAVAHLRHVLGGGSAAVGGLPAAILVFAQIVHVHALERQRFVQGLFQQALLSSFWPLFLVIFAFLLLGVVLGGVATWFASSPVRRERRRWQREAERLDRELDIARRPRGGGNRTPAPLALDDLMDTR